VENGSENSVAAPERKVKAGGVELLLEKLGNQVSRQVLRDICKLGLIFPCHLYHKFQELVEKSSRFIYAAYYLK
jgi:hypothetical protein